MDREKVIKGLEHCANGRNGCFECPYSEDGFSATIYCKLQIDRDALALLKEQENLKEKLLRNIADNQLAVSPTGYETEEELAKRTGEWNGLQMAYEIVLNDGN